MEIRKYWEILVRRKWLFIQALAVILLVALLICFIPRIYSISATLQITGQDLQPQFVGDMPSNLGKISNTSPALNELETLQSYELITQLINDLKLADSSGTPYSPVKFTNPGFITTVTQGIGVSINNPEDTDIIEISGISTKPDEAVAIANGLVQRYLALKSMTNQRDAKKAIAYISEQLPKVKDELAQAEEEQQSFSTQEHLATVDTQRTNLANQLDALNSALLSSQRTIKTDQEKKQAIKTELAKQPELQQATINTESNPNLKLLKDTLYGLERDLAQLTSQYTNEHPDVKSKLEQIDQTKKQIKEQIEKTYSSSALSRNAYYDNLIQSYGNNEIELVTTAATEKKLANQIQEVTQKLDSIDRKAMELARLDRVTTSLRNRYNTLLSQLQNAKLAAKLEVTNVVIVSSAAVPTAKKVLKTYIYFPKRKWVLIIGAILGVMFGLFLVYFIEYIDDRIYRAEQIQEITSVPVLATIPFSHTGITPRSSVSPEINEPISDLSILLLANKATDKPLSISMVSRNNSEGKTFITAALAIAFAGQGRKILVINGNPKSPRLAELFNITGTTPGNEINPITTAIDRLDFIERIPQSMLENPGNLDQLLQKYGQNYAVILIDTQSLSHSTLGKLIAQQTQQTILIIGAGISTGSQLKPILTDIIKTQNPKISGIILNHPTQKSSPKS